MRAYAFLDATATDALSGARWPVPGDAGPGAWLESGAARGCTAGQLLWWLDRDLWEVELAGEVQARGRGLVAERGRLLAPVASWTPEVARALLVDCALRARDRAVDALGSDGHHAEAAALASAGDLESIAEAAAAASSADGDGALLAGYTADLIRFSTSMSDPARGAAIAARVASHTLAGGDERAPGYDEAYAVERRRQAQWLRSRLGL
jgi:hypothetical protein